MNGKSFTRRVLHRNFTNRGDFPWLFGPEVRVTPVSGRRGHFAGCREKARSADLPGTVGTGMNANLTFGGIWHVG